MSYPSDKTPVQRPDVSPSCYVSLDVEARESVPSHTSAIQSLVLIELGLALRQLTLGVWLPRVSDDGDVHGERIPPSANPVRLPAMGLSR